ncbi:MAG: polyribonucleotide nucleotidyltransferase [Alphaproteobacteria bacterium]|nr:polyribonucleotide nucleotidyltransferase [Alphaproteobacteria bacterium]
MNILHTYTTTLDGISIEAMVTDLAIKTESAILMKALDSQVFVTVAVGKHSPDKDYFPLRVDFEEKFYSVGALLGSRYSRREGKPSDEATLKARIIDRTIRPLFPTHYKKEIWVCATVLVQGSFPTEMLAVLGASIALNISSVPFHGPISGVRMILNESKWCIGKRNTSAQHVSELTVCGMEEGITMIEMGGNQIEKTKVKTGIDASRTHIQSLQQFQRNIIKEIGKTKEALADIQIPTAIQDAFTPVQETMRTLAISHKKNEINTLSSTWHQTLISLNISDAEKIIGYDLFDNTLKKIINEMGIISHTRIDGRKLTDLRSLHAEAGGFSQLLHGTGTFYRGDTHIMTVLTLASPDKAQLIDAVGFQESKKRFIHHYNFPQYATGEVGKIGSPGRREIGHGALAEKALLYVIPKEEIFPYTIRLVSESFTSDGSTSMASVCASTLALMDGGVPIDAPVAGIAMGLLIHNNTYEIITDLSGFEDHYGYMDFKVAGTVHGITAMQLDIKSTHIPIEVIHEAIDRSCETHIKILSVMHTALEKPRPHISTSAPHIEQMNINPDDIGLIIGSGGKVIKKIKEDYALDGIDIVDSGVVTITGKKEQVSNVIQHIKHLTKQFDIGSSFTGVVTKVVEFGAFVEIVPEVEGLVHVSEFSPERILSPFDVLHVGDTVPIILKNIDHERRLSLSIKMKDPHFFDPILKKLKNI